MNDTNLSSISRADTDEKMGEFWDNQDFTEFDDPSVPDAKFEITSDTSARDLDALRAEVQRKAAELANVPREQLAAQFLQLADKLRAEAIVNGIVTEPDDREKQLHLIE